MKTCRKYENPIEFLETYKIWLDTNRPPSVEDDEALWERLVPIPFHDPTTIDRELPAKLRAEAEGILAWLVQGAKLWYAEGLGALPDEWMNVHSLWRRKENKFRQFVKDCCELRGTVSPSELLEAQHIWAGHNREKHLNRNELAKSLRALNCTEIRKHGGVRVWRGISLKDQE
jgi:putative DNA primase/helicase